MDCGSFQANNDSCLQTLPDLMLWAARIDRKLRDRAGHECGVIGGNIIVVVVDGPRAEKPSFSRI
jgi:hypothetical protein